ncbi:hypothetical protein ACOMHN_018733 [Nucella lapillus]
MEEKEQQDGFDDFFDTPGRSIDDSAISAVKFEQVNKSGVSSDDASSQDYSSDSVTDSDSDTDSDSRKRKKGRSRSRSASSRSGGSVSSDRSYSSVETKESKSRSSRKNARRSRSRAWNGLIIHRTLSPVLATVNNGRIVSPTGRKGQSFLRRLQKVRPSRGLSRNEQLDSYNTTVLHGIPMATLHPPGSGGLASGRQSSAGSIAGSLGQTRSMTSIHSAATASSFGTASRQSSRAGSRPTSAKKSYRERPAWNDRW